MMSSYVLVVLTLYNINADLNEISIWTYDSKLSLNSLKPQAEVIRKREIDTTYYPSTLIYCIIILPSKFKDLEVAPNKSFT